MSVLAQIVQAAQAYDRFVEQQVHDARTDPVSGEKARQRWHQIRAGIRHVTTPTGLTLPRLALPQTDDPGEIARYLHGEGLPGEFPYVNSAYPELYVIPATAAAPDGAGSGSPTPPPAALESPKKTEEPTRLFAGLGGGHQPTLSVPDAPAKEHPPEHRLRRPYPLRTGQRCRRGFWQDRRRGRGHRYHRRHGTALRRVPAGGRAFFGLDDH